MRVVVIQYETRRDTSLRVLMKYAENYCNRHEYTYWCPEGEYNMPTYWVKVHLVQQALTMFPGEDLGVAWLDSDAVFVKPDIRVEDILRSKDFVTSVDPGFTDTMNAGVFFIRRNHVTVQLVSDWFSCYDPKRWTKDAEGKWITEGRWAGPDYEQGSFNERILPRYRQVVLLEPESVFACYEAFHEPDTIVCHFMYKHKWKIWLFHARQQMPEVFFWFTLGSLAVFAYGKK
jgi:hypothetical protein